MKWFSDSSECLFIYRYESIKIIIIMILLNFYWRQTVFLNKYSLQINKTAPENNKRALCVSFMLWIVPGIAQVLYFLYLAEKFKGIFYPTNSTPL